MTQEFELTAKTFQGLEEVLAKELTELGANNVRIGRRMVSFTGDKMMMYKANFCLRTAIRILKPIKTFKADDPDKVYEEIKKINWSEYMTCDQTFAVDAVIFSEDFKHSKFVAYRVKDAIADYFREKDGKRPSVSVANPEIPINIHISEQECTVSLDSSGQSLHKRGYRKETMEAPLNEVLAAGMILLTGWHGQCDFIDPMCGSGTLPIEAALIARNIAPGVFRQDYAFEHWANFDKDMFEAIYNDDSREREFEHRIFAYDNNPQAVLVAEDNIKSAGCMNDIILRVRPFQQFTQPENKSIIVTNPPYGERISSRDLLGLYQMIGERLKHEFAGNNAWILSYREECFDEIGLKPNDRISLYNGGLACEFRRYQIFDGKYNDFKAGIGDKHFKTNRGFFKANHLGRRLGEEEERDERDDSRGRGFRRRDDRDERRGGGFRRRDERDDRRERGFRRRDDRDDRRGGGFRRRDERDDRRGGGFRRDNHEERSFGERKRPEIKLRRPRIKKQ